MPSRPEVTGRRRPATVTTTNAAQTATLADDVLIGAEAIAHEIGIPVRKAFHWLQQGYLPATKVGSIWTSSRSALRQHFSDAAVREASARKAARDAGRRGGHDEVTRTPIIARDCRV